MTKSILDTINKPQDVKNLTEQELITLGEEIRYHLLNKVSTIGGHLGPNLGMVEATIALHYVFDSPTDKIVWDVSHQSYPHKMLTGRKAAFTNPEKYKTVTGYSSQHESEHDFFTVGHTSTSISLATGLAKARDLQSQTGNVIAVIGDGSLSGGLAFEGLNNGAVLNSNFIVLVNDNEMSIAENNGGLYANLALLRETNGTAANNYFTALGFDYLYVEEGNDVQALISAFKSVKDSNKPIVVHIHTLKGKGYKPAETKKEAFHWHVPFDIETGLAKQTNATESYMSVAIDFLGEQVEKDNRIVAINAAIPGGLGLSAFRAKYPNKYFDVGIAEGHSISFASSLASQGMKPVVLHMSTFIQRAYDQISQDLCINNNSAVILVKGGAISGSDVTHLGSFDIAMMSNIPNLVYLAPSSKEELIAMFAWSLTQDAHPIAIRVPGSEIVTAPVPVKAFDINTYQVVDEGQDVAIIGLGNFLELGKQVQEQLFAHNINATLINPRFITGIDKKLLQSLEANHKVVITLEDGILDGGFGEKISRFYGDSEMKTLNFGALKEFTDSVPLAELYERYNLTPELITKDILAIIK